MLDKAAELPGGLLMAFPAWTGDAAEPLLPCGLMYWCHYLLTYKSHVFATFSLTDGVPQCRWVCTPSSVSPPACPARPAHELAWMSRVSPFSSAFSSAPRIVSLGFFCLCFEVSKLLSVLRGTEEPAALLSPRLSFLLRNFGFNANALRSHVQYCITRGTLEMSRLL